MYLIIVQQFQLTLATDVSAYSQCLHTTISVSNDYTINWSGYQGTAASLLTVTVTDSTNVVPVIYVCRKRIHMAGVNIVRYIGPIAQWSTSRCSHLPDA